MTLGPSALRPFDRLRAVSNAEPLRLEEAEQLAGDCFADGGPATVWQAASSNARIPPHEFLA
jgi:hypothetical protein